MKEQTLEQTFEELDSVIASLQTGDLPLEESFTLYQKGMKLLKKCNDKLDRVEKKVMAMNEGGGWDEF